MSLRPTTPHRLLVPGIVLVLAGCGPIGGPSPSPAQPPGATAQPAGQPILKWPAPTDPMKLTVDAGLVPEPREQLAFHAHAHLDVFIDGAPVLVPAGIGINVDDPEVVRFDDPGGVGYGGIELCAQPCISPLHTHAGSGILHTESATAEPNTLGQFFVEWGVPLSETCVGEFCSPKAIAFYINGAAYTGDPRTIGLTDRTQIAIVIGSPPATIPSTADFTIP